MATEGEERIAKGIEALVRLGNEIKQEWRVQRLAREKESHTSIIPDKVMPLPEGPPYSPEHLIKGPFIALTGITTNDAKPGEIRFFGQLFMPDGSIVKVRGQYEEY